jgi:phosphoglycolate phosphatase-like HAD superfamily hydrolase
MEFGPLLDFSKPFPVELQGDGWWARANEILVSKGTGVRDLLPTVVANSRLTPRPGAVELLRRLVELRVPVLIVSAGFRNVIELWLEGHGIDCPDHLLRVSSNCMQFSQDGDVSCVEPHPPMTSLNKGETFRRNRDWLKQHATRNKLVVMGDRLNDLKVAEGAPPSMTCLGVGICNDGQTSELATPLEQYCDRFDLVICGDQGSLAPVTRLIDELD